MPITSGDIKLVKSQVMLDTPEGGGAPTSGVVEDGTSNSIFPDISEVDRAGGRVNLRKLFVSVQTADTDQYFGANVIVADPPDDPRVSVTLFTTEDTFDRRTNAQNRMESYLAQGGIYSGYLFGNHITGMRILTILQREEIALPVVGDTFVLRAFEGAGNQVEQYVRASDVSSIIRTFSDASGDFKRRQVTIEITDALRADYPGFDAIRLDASINYAGKTKIYSTIVADAARYYGVVPLETAVEIGDFTAKGTGIFTQLVPSTRFEVPIGDARMNNQSATLVSAGEPYTRNLTMTFEAGNSMFVGGSILPGTLSIARGGVTVTDRGGVMYDIGSNQVGTVDYENGIVTLTSSVFGSGTGTHTVTYTPASRPTIVSESIGVPVTAQGQRLSYSLTLDPLPVRSTLTISYRTLNNWYVLSEDGSGAIRGSDSSFGAGTINFGTGNVTVTLGALPDVDSQVIFTYQSAVAARTVTALAQAGPALARAFGKAVTTGSALNPGSLTFTWNDGSVRTASDSGGTLTGDATGTVNYTTGEIVFRPNTLPAKNTAISLAISTITKTDLNINSLIDSGANWTLNLGVLNVKPNTVEIGVTANAAFKTGPRTTANRYFPLRVTDNGSGSLVTGNVSSNLVVGTINYATGVCTLSKSIGGYNVEQPTFSPVYGSSNPNSGFISVDYRQSGVVVQPTTLNIMNGAGIFSSQVESAPWQWWAGVTGFGAIVRVSSGAASPTTYPFTFDEIFLPNNPNTFTVNRGYTPKIQSFFLGSSFYVRRETDFIVDPSPTTGTGTVVGSDATLGNVAGVLLTTWTAGVSSQPTSVSGVGAPSLTGTSTPLTVSGVTFRTAVAPLFNGGFQIAGNWYDDASSLTATANASGFISTGSAVVGETPGSYGVFGVVDYEYLPLDADLLGLDPVRLPSDGRVPIFRPGSFAVIGNTGTVGPVTVSNGQTINCGRVRLSRVRVIGNNGQVITVGYTENLDAGTVTFSDVTGYSQPVTVEHRIEDMLLVSDAQINGQLTFTRAITHDYPAPGSYISSALVAGDLRARVSVLFDQATWTNVFQDTLIGSSANATFNDIQYPIAVTNRGALTERWAVQFLSTTTFQVIGEKVGIIANGNTSADCAPINPATGQPYFSIPFQGWGAGWATGNVLRFNIVGTFYPVWVTRTVLQGPETVINDSFTLLVRGDVDRP